MWIGNGSSRPASRSPSINWQQELQQPGQAYQALPGPARPCQALARFNELLGLIATTRPTEAHSTSVSSEHIITGPERNGHSGHNALQAGNGFSYSARLGSNRIIRIHATPEAAYACDTCSQFPLAVTCRSPVAQHLSIHVTQATKQHGHSHAFLQNSDHKTTEQNLRTSGWGWLSGSLPSSHRSGRSPLFPDKRVHVHASCTVIPASLLCGFADCRL